MRELGWHLIKFFCFVCCKVVVVQLGEFGLWPQQLRLVLWTAWKKRIHPVFFSFFLFLQAAETYMSGPCFSLVSNLFMFSCKSRKTHFNKGLSWGVVEGCAAGLPFNTDKTDNLFGSNLLKAQTWPNEPLNNQVTGNTGALPAFLCSSSLNVGRGGNTLLSCWESRGPAPHSSVTVVHLPLLLLSFSFPPSSFSP